MTDKILIDRSVLEQALGALNASMPHNNDMETEWPEHIAARRALRAALEQPDHSEQPLDMVPTGWKLVPAAMTDEMAAADKELRHAVPWVRWEAILAAAPQPPVVEQPQIGEVVVTTSQQGHCVAVTRQDDEGQVLSVIWEAKQPRVEQPVAWIRGLPEEATHIAAAKAKVRSGGQIDISIRAFKYDDGVLMVYVTDNDNEYPGWRKAADAFYHLNFPVIPISTHPQPPRQPLTDEEINEAYGAAYVQYNHVHHEDVVRIARAIERAHGIGGEA